MGHLWPGSTKDNFASTETGLHWLGHMHRTASNRITRQALTSFPEKKVWKHQEVLKRHTVRRPAEHRDDVG